MNNEKNEANIYCIFPERKDNANTQIEKAFEIYLKDLLKTKDLSLDKTLRKD